MSELSNKLNGHSGNDELRTPGYLFNWLCRRFRFTFDAAASNDNHRCEVWATADGVYGLDQDCWGRTGPAYSKLSEKDGLSVPWAHQRVFVNPPYSRPLLGQFITKAIEERDAADIIVMLVKCDTSTENFRLLQQYSHIEYLRRVRYDDEDGNPLPAATFASCLAILRPSEPRP